MRLIREQSGVTSFKRAVRGSVPTSETLEQYFARPDTPAWDSPTGRTLRKVLAKFLGVSFEDARQKANELLNAAAKSRVYRGPVVLSAEELAQRMESLRKASARAGKVKDAA